MNRILRIIIKLVLFIIISTGLLYLLLIHGNINFKKYFGGIIINNSCHNIYISDYRTLKMLRPGENSRKAGIFDADVLIILHPTKFENKVHNQGIIKFCDAGTLEIITNSGMDIVKVSPLTSICKFIDDFGWYSHMPIKTIKKP